MTAGVFGVAIRRTPVVLTQMMIAMHKLILLSTFLTVPGIAQEHGQSPSTEVRILPTGAAKWIQQLGSDDYRDRLNAENKLREMGTRAVQELKAAAGDGGDGEIQWRAKRLLRQIDQASVAKRGAANPGQNKAEKPGPGLVERRRSGPSPQVDVGRNEDRLQQVGGIEEVKSEFDRLFRRMEELRGVDLQHQRLFDDTFLQDLKAQLDATSSGQGKSVQITPDGVRVEITETGKDGKSDTKVYEAPDMDSFHKQFPGVLEKGRAGLGLRPFAGLDLNGLFDVMRVDVGGLQRGFDLDLLKPQRIPFDQGVRRTQIGATPAASVPPTGRRLGVVIKPIPESLRDYLELDRGHGLMVESVQGDSLAASLGLRAGDIVLGINDEKIASAADVRKVLGAIKKGSDVDVSYVRRGERRAASAKKKHDAEADRAALKPKKVRESIR